MKTLPDVASQLGDALSCLARALTAGTCRRVLLCAAGPERRGVVVVLVECDPSEPAFARRIAGATPGPPCRLAPADRGADDREPAELPAPQAGPPARPALRVVAVLAAGGASRRQQRPRRRRRSVGCRGLGQPSLPREERSVGRTSPQAYRLRRFPSTSTDDRLTRVSSGRYAVRSRPPDLCRPSVWPVADVTDPAPASLDGPGQQRPVESHEALLDAVRAGDASAFAQLVAVWSPSLLRTAMVLTGDRRRAEELVRQTWLRLLAEVSVVPARRPGCWPGSAS